MEHEEWRAIPSLPEYEASTLGRIRRLVTERPMPHGGVRQYGGHAWFGAWEGGQRRFILQFRGKTHKVARLVCEAFNGPAPPGMPDVMHDDEDSRNNRPGNLKWGNQHLNLNYPGFRAHSSEARRGCRINVLPDADIAVIKRRILNGDVMAKIARDYGVSACHISNIKAGRARRNVDAALK